jgi:hypothetical protein
MTPISTERLRALAKNDWGREQRIRMWDAADISPKEVGRLAAELLALRSPSPPEGIGEAVAWRWRFSSWPDTADWNLDDVDPSDNVIPQGAIVQPLYAAPVPSPAIAEARKQAFEEASQIADSLMQPWRQFAASRNDAMAAGMARGAMDIADAIRRTAQGENGK